MRSWPANWIWHKKRKKQYSFPSSQRNYKSFKGFFNYWAITKMQTTAECEWAYIRACVNLGINVSMCIDPMQVHCISLMFPLRVSEYKNIINKKKKALLGQTQTRPVRYPDSESCQQQMLGKEYKKASRYRVIWHFQQSIRGCGDFLKLEPTSGAQLLIVTEMHTAQVVYPHTRELHLVSEDQHQTLHSSAAGEPTTTLLCPHLLKEPPFWAVFTPGFLCWDSQLKLL